MLVPEISFGLNRPPLILCDEVQFIRVKVVNAASEQPAVIGLGHPLAVGSADDVGSDRTQIVLSRIIGVTERDGGLRGTGVEDIPLAVAGIACNLVQQPDRVHHFTRQEAGIIVVRSGRSRIRRSRGSGLGQHILTDRHTLTREVCPDSSPDADGVVESVLIFVAEDGDSDVAAALQIGSKDTLDDHVVCKG